MISQLLVDAILQRIGAPEDQAAELRTDDFLAHLSRHSWPGNVRELRNYLERCLALQFRPPLDELDGPQESDEGNVVVDLGQPLKAARTAWTRKFERAYLAGMLQKHDGNVTAAARAAGVDRIYFHRLLRRAGLR